MKRVRRIAVIVLIAVLLGYAYYWAFYDIQRIKWQEIMEETTSPDGRYTVTAYLTNGGATTAFGVLGGVIDNETGKERKFYWQYRCEEAQMQWLNENTVIFNGVVLDVRRDTFDYRYDSQQDKPESMEEIL